MQRDKLIENKLEANVIIAINAAKKQLKYF